GALPSVAATTPPDPGPPPAPSSQPSTSPLFTQAEQQTPAAPASSQATEFHSVLRPFAAGAFATGIAQSHANIGPMAALALPDGPVPASGGRGRNQLFRLGPGGGPAGAPLATLPEPVYNLALDGSGRLWAATGGGPLLRLDPQTGAVLAQYGDGLTQE